MSAIIKAISDDAFAGRAIDTPEGQAAAKWIAQAMTERGLKPGGDLDPATGQRTFFQKVPIKMRDGGTVYTYNIIGVLEGSDEKKKDDYILYTAHWDHLGKKKPDPNNPKADIIYNGAVDNGTGIASILEIAEAFKNDPVKPKRSIAFVAFTAEELGMLGSQYFANHLPWPSNHIVGGINIDEDIPKGHTRDLAVLGYGTSAYSSEMERLLAAALKRQGRVISPDPEPSKNYYERSDHFSLARKGIPMLMPFNGVDLIDYDKAHFKNGADAGNAVRKNYEDKKYHQVSDEWDPNWLKKGELDGPVDDARALFEVGKTLATEQADFWPDWNKDGKFRTIRDADMAARKTPPTT